MQQHVPSEGYPQLAAFMSKAPETQIFRSFGQLGILNVIRLQAELQDLESQLQDFQNTDCVREPNLASLVRSFWTMRDQSETGTHDKLAKLLDTIDVKLERYHTALLQLHHVRNLQPPTERDMDCLVKWFRGITGSDFLSGSERNMWPNRNNEKYTDLIRDEYVTIDPRASKRDYFSLFLEGKLLDLYHEVWRRMSSNNSGVGTEPLVEYKTSRFEAISTSIAVALSSLLPVLSILALYFVRKMILRIVLVLIFTTLFSVFLKVFTNARTAEIYSATAAFAAVEVVFIGSDNINTA